MKDNGTNLGGALSGVFQNANDFPQYMDESGQMKFAGSNISITGIQY